MTKPATTPKTLARTAAADARAATVLAERRAGKTLAAIGQAMGLTPERIRQIERRGELQEQRQARDADA